MNILLLKKNNIFSSHIFIAKRFVSRFLLLMIGCNILINAQSQDDKRLILADKYFEAGDYYTAAGLYEQFLKPSVKQKMPTGFPLNSKKNQQGRTSKQLSKTDILYKQAESFRLANYWPEAADRYKQCLEKDPAKYASGIYWFAVCNRSIGNYDIAEENVNLFLSGYAAGNPYQPAAQQELETIQFIKNQLARPDSVLFTIQKINTSFGKEKGIFAPSVTGENKFIITSTQADSVITTGINPFHNRIFYSTLSDGSMQSIEPVEIEGIDPALNQATPTLSADGKYLYFTQWKKEKGQSISSIFYSVKKENGWSSPILIPLINMEAYNSKQPFCSADGKYLFFASDRPGGQGKFDIWYAAIKTDGTIAEPVNAGTAINTDGNEQAPFYHNSSNTLVFSSDRAPGMGGYDLFASTGQETNWKKPENMGHPVNSSRDDLYFLTRENETLLNKAIISSDRGSDCCLEVYVVNKKPRKKMIAGMIRDCRNNEPLASAGVVMKDNTGKSWRTTTGNDGTYQFELVDNVNQQQFFVSKELYKEKTAAISITSTNDSDWLTEVLSNTEICLDKKLVIKPETVVSVYFDFDKSEIKPRGLEQLDSIYNVLVENTTATIQISGYTDGRGSIEYNKVLSDKRAKACADYLIQKGIDSSKVTFESFGACCPVEMELINGRDNPDGRSRNRRALINITKD